MLLSVVVVLLLLVLVVVVWSRFSNMLSWEDSEHPVVVFNMDSPHGVEVSGLDLLSLNPR